MADIVISASRAGYIGWVQSGVALGLALAPIIGGILATFLGSELSFGFPESWWHLPTFLCDLRPRDLS